MVNEADLAHGFHDTEEEGVRYAVDDQLAQIVLLKKSELDDFKASQG